MNVEVRVAVASDAEALINLSREFDPDSEIQSDANKVMEHILNAEGEIIFVSARNGILIGFATLQVTHSFCYDRPTSELTGIYVKPTERRNGAARKLVEAARNESEKLKVLEMFLRENFKNSGANDFYKHVGMELAQHQTYRYRYY
jgi:aminoglycoside 6'-N-acetyltransferase I